MVKTFWKKPDVGLFLFIHFVELPNLNSSSFYRKFASLVEVQRFMLPATFNNVCSCVSTFLFVFVSWFLTIQCRSRCSVRTSNPSGAAGLGAAWASKSIYGYYKLTPTHLLLLLINRYNLFKILACSTTIPSISVLCYILPAAYIHAPYIF